MDETIVDQKLQGPINRDRCQPLAGGGGEPVDHLIGTKGCPGRAQDVKDALARGGQRNRRMVVPVVSAGPMVVPVLMIAVLV